MRTTLDVDKNRWPELWQQTCQILENHFPRETIRTWIYSLELADTEDLGQNRMKVHMAAVNEFSANWVRDKYRREIEFALTQVTGSECELVVATRDGGQGAPVYAPPVEYVANQGSGGAVNTGTVLHTGNRQIGSNDNPVDVRYTFENFVVGASNQFAHASAVAVSEHPARQYNPLFIFSPPGLGKTHLLHAIGNHLISKTPGTRVAYLSAEKFVNEMIDSIQHNRMSQFRAKYRDSYDVILIDDIQFIAGKSASEEEFFHTFNTLHGSKRQIVMTSDRPPKEIEGLEARLRTRFEWGLVSDIRPPEIETRIAILKSKAERDDIYVPDDVATFLASYIKSNVRELEGVLVKLQAHASMTGAEITLDMAKTTLKTSIPEESSHFTVDSIQNTVSKYFRITPKDLKSPSRVKKFSMPRQIAMFLVRKYTGLPVETIGEYFGGRDHSTVVYALQKVEEELETTPNIRESVEAIQDLL
ncbi:MAG: chromosomal replication initiator protein DnaA [Bdellovibrionota bacterium]